MKDKYYKQLDGLRFFAVLMVMVAHWLQWQWSNPILQKIPFVHGVTLFFVLSGFLITNILIQQKVKVERLNANKWTLLKTFYWRRFLRIMPIYYLLILFLFIIDYQNTRTIFPWLASFSTNIYQSMTNEYLGEFNHFWSLGVEEQFYLFWPLFILFLNRRNLLIFILIVIITGLSFRIYYEQQGFWMAISYAPNTAMHALGLGALLAFFKNYHALFYQILNNKKAMWITMLLYLIQLSLFNYFQWKKYGDVFDEFFFSIVATLIIAVAAQDGFKSMIKFVLASKFVIYAGKISYGMYLFHLFVPTLFLKIAQTFQLNISNKYELFVIYYLLTFLLASASWKMIEAPLQKLKEKFIY